MVLVKKVHPIISFSLLLSIIVLYTCKESYDPNEEEEEEIVMSLSDIETNLLDNPPGYGNPDIREKSILALDKLLKDDFSRTDRQMKSFYISMMNKVSDEIEDSVSTATIWMMYNHGFVIKTPDLTFAFDLVHGYGEWSEIYLPMNILSQIKVLFVSHEHEDHYSANIRGIVLSNGGHVIVPSEVSWIGSIGMAAEDTISLMGLKIKAYFGLHSEPSRIYEVVNKNGLKFLHTGDNQTSTYLPDINNVDVLLLNAWVNESGTESAFTGMRNCLTKLNPDLMIPGHIQELGHDYNPNQPASRVPYSWAIDVARNTVSTEVQVMAWGECYSIPEDTSVISSIMPGN
jgi:L-ascorbate metabolism protein UlaG (beta-lactamase superfamily)